MAAILSLLLLTVPPSSALASAVPASGIQGATPDQTCEDDINGDGTWDIQDIVWLVRGIQIFTGGPLPLGGVEDSYLLLLLLALVIRLVQFREAASSCGTPDPKVLIFPPAKCFKPGEDGDLRFCFGRAVVGAEDQSVTWEATHNGASLSISPKGCLTVPSEPGLGLITATSVESPELKGEAHIRVGDCGCWFTVQHEGITAGGPGDQAIVQFGASQGEIIGINLFAGSNAVAILPAAFPQGIPNGAVGTFPVKAGGTVGLPPGTVFGTPEEGALPILSLQANHQQAVAGLINGTVLISEAGITERPARLSISFSIEREEGASIPGQLGCVVN